MLVDEVEHVLKEEGVVENEEAQSAKQSFFEVKAKVGSMCKGSESTTVTTSETFTAHIFR